MSSSERGHAAAELEYRVFNPRRPGLSRDVPPGYEPLLWVSNSSTLIAGERDAVLVDTFLTIEHGVKLADELAATGKNLTHIYITHGHGDHFFGINALKERFPDVRAVATASVVGRMEGQLADRRRRCRLQRHPSLPRRDRRAVAAAMDRRARQARRARTARRGRRAQGP